MNEHSSKHKEMVYVLSAMGLPFKDLYKCWNSTQNLAT